jgi:hypothetical protein
MLIFTRFKLASSDKRITQLLRESKFYNSNKNRDKIGMSLKDANPNELWIREVEIFIEIVWKEKKFRNLIEAYNLKKQDLIDFYILMTIATLPNPIFKTGNSKLSHTLVGSAIYQEINKHFKKFLQSLGQYNIKGEEEQFGHRFASDVMSYALDIKFAHELAYGDMTLEEVL